MIAFRRLTPDLGWGEPLPEGWAGLTAVSLLIFVGLTGVGKSSTVQALSEAGLDFEHLPNRRAITDELIIGTVQAAWGQPRRAIMDRVERFAYTRHYRQMHPGGMAHALSQLAVNVAGTGNPAWWLFDGLRGAEEVTAAVDLFPQARFVVLQARDETRIERLLGRGDSFDQLGSVPQGGAGAAFRLGEWGDFLPPTAVARLEHLVQTGQIPPDEMLAKVKIVRTERENYDPDTAVSALQTLAPDRTLVMDTEALSPAEIAARVVLSDER